MWIWSLNHSTMAMVSLVAQVWLHYFRQNPKSVGPNMIWQWWHVDGSSPPHAVYECSQTPCICLEWRLETFHVALELESLHSTISMVSNVALVQIQGFCQTLKYGPKTDVAMVAWWWILQLTHSLWKFSNTLDVWNYGWKYSMWVWSLNHSTMAMVSLVAQGWLHYFLPQTPKSGQTIIVEMAGWILLPTHSI